MLKKLVLIDLDKTLVDQNYQITISIEKLHETIRRARSHGLIVGLCSDSSATTLSRIALEYGIEGPIIAERGAMIKIGEEEIRVIPDTVVFPDIRTSFINNYLELMVDDILLVVGDVNQLSREFLSPTFSVRNTTAKTAVLINGSRKASLSFYVLANHNGRWKNDSAMLDEVSSQFITLGSKLAGAWWKDAFIEKNNDYGIGIIHHPNSEKTIALPILQDKFKIDEIWMIGDSMSDLLKQPRIQHAAVANAIPEFKSHCQLVSSQTFTAGVVELLEKLMSFDVKIN
ncbi:MAG: HAD hydrolase family protein [Candidatus Paceibacterota bacterium]|jgi:hydroxymethylpyrimidine pyrophosphatase-like HAD family hydrolase